jgi:hypothetical protein
MTRAHVLALAAFIAFVTMTAPPANWLLGPANPFGSFSRPENVIDGPMGWPLLHRRTEFIFTLAGIARTPSFFNPQFYCTELVRRRSTNLPSPGVVVSPQPNLPHRRSQYLGPEGFRRRPVAARECKTAPLQI